MNKQLRDRNERLSNLLRNLIHMNYEDKGLKIIEEDYGNVFEGTVGILEIPDIMELKKFMCYRLRNKGLSPIHNKKRLAEILNEITNLGMQYTVLSDEESEDEFAFGLSQVPHMNELEQLLCSLSDKHTRTRSRSRSRSRSKKRSTSKKRSRSRGGSKKR